VIGRSPATYGEWFYVRNDEGVEGYSHSPRFDWAGDFDTLPEVAPTAAPVTRSPSNLTLDIWDLPSTARCVGGNWYKSIFMEARGGNGFYTYYWNDAWVGGPTSGSITFEVHGIGAIIGNYRVVSGDGQVLADSFYVSGVECAP
jgi:hypothetical protein